MTQEPKKSPQEIVRELSSLSISVNKNGSGKQITSLSISLWIGIASDSVRGVCISHIATHPDYRNMGLASMLIAGVLSLLDRHGIDCCIDPNGSIGLTEEQKVAWYRRYGFEPGEDTMVRKAKND